MGKLQGKVAVITGGTQGVGLATARLFASEGAYVFIAGRRQKELEEAVALIGSNVTGVQADVANLADLDRLYASVKAKGRIDVLFANVGLGGFVPLGSITEEYYDKTFDTNVKGLLFTVQKALPFLNDGASIILTGSAAAAKGTPSFGVYAASKAAIRSFVRTWTAELKDRRIRSNVLSPGPVLTPQVALQPPEAIARIVSTVPKRSPRPRSFWVRTIPASSPGSNCSPMAAERRSDLRPAAQPHRGVKQHARTLHRWMPMRLRAFCIDDRANTPGCLSLQRMPAPIRQRLRHVHAGEERQPEGDRPDKASYAYRGQRQ
jgi:NAD(P)-dependent dehydrogenase (short-subunit alcohol dehydrogenase family)